MRYKLYTPVKYLIWFTGKFAIYDLNPQFIKPEPTLNADFQLNSSSHAINEGHKFYFNNSDFFWTKEPTDGIANIVASGI